MRKQKSVFIRRQLGGIPCSPSVPFCWDKDYRRMMEMAVNWCALCLMSSIISFWFADGSATIWPTPDLGHPFAPRRAEQTFFFLKKSDFASALIAFTFWKSRWSPDLSMIDFFAFTPAWDRGRSVSAAIWLNLRLVLKKVASEGFQLTVHFGSL